MTRVPVVCAVWCCDVCTAGGTQLRDWQIMGHHPGLHNMDWIPMWEPAHAAPSAPLGDTQVFLCPKLCDTLCFYRENMNHKAPIAFAVSIIHLIWPVKFDIYHDIYPIHYINQHYLKNQYILQGVPYHWAHFVFVIFSGSRAHTEELFIAIG